MSAFGSAEAGMANGGSRGGLDAEMVRELSQALERASEREDRLMDRLEEAIGVMREVNRNQKDIKEIQSDLYSRDGLMSRMTAVEHRGPTVEVPDPRDESSGIRLSTGSLVTIAIAIVTAAFSGLWQIISWIVQLAQQVGR